MDKNTVDEIMVEYVPKIFGFTFSKLTNTDKAHWRSTLPAMPEELKAISKEMGSKRYAVEIQGVPPHLHDIHRLPTDNNALCCQDFITHVLAKLLADGVLKMPAEAQKKTLNTIMVCDVLPAYSKNR